MIIRSWIAAGVLAAVPFALEAQDVKYTETTKVETFMPMPGMGGPTRSTTWISNGRVRTDDGEQATVMNYADLLMTQIDHDAKTYFTMSLGDMMAAAGDMMAQTRADAERARADAERARAEAAAQDPGMQMEFDLKVERLGDGGMVSGYATERVMLILEARTTSTTSDPGTGEEVSGTFVFVTDMWVSNEFPGFRALQEAQMAAAAEASEALREDMTEMMESSREMIPAGAMFGGGGGLERMAEEMAKIDGTPLRTLTYQIMLAEGTEFDKDAVIALADQPISSFSLKDAFGEAARASARDAISGKLGGMLGRRREQPKPQAAEAGQAVFMRITSTIEEVSTEPIPASVFQPDPGYQEKKPEWLKSAGGVRPAA